MSAIQFTQVLYLLNSVAVDTTGTGIQLNNSYFTNFAVTATSFGGGNVMIQTSIDNVNWITLTYLGSALLVSENSEYVIPSLKQGQYVRAVLQGSTGASAVTATLL